MPKIPIVDEAEATDEQRRVGAPIFAERGTGFSGPYGILLHHPELTEKAGELGSFLRGGAGLPRRLSELVIALTARHWTAQFEWAAHHHQALSHGLDASVLEAIRTRRRPDFAAEDEEIVYDYVTQLYANKGIDDAVHRRAEAAFDLEVTRPDPPPPLAE